VLKTVLTVVVSVVSACVVTIAVLQAQQRAQGPTLSAMDYQEIHQLYARYAHGIDSGNGELYASVFTSDGVFNTPTATIAGSSELAAFARGNGSKLPLAANHFVTNVLIEPTADGARGRAYLLIVSNNDPLAARGGAITNRGVYQDVLVKTQDGWRIRNRTYTNRDSMPQAAVPQPAPPR
jgi:hypothetical protein